MVKTPQQTSNQRLAKLYQSDSKNLAPKRREELTIWVFTFKGRSRSVPLNDYWLTICQLNK